jgi:predicted membrane-bound mannosyltransferase
MSSGGINSEDRWRLGGEPEEHREEREPPADASHAPAVSNPSHERLTRPVYVVTVEHLGWCAVGAYAVMTRVMALGARPLDPGEARLALAAFAGEPDSWTTILQSRIFAELGAGDAISRIVVALCGLILIASGFAMRRCLGRAGALAFAAMLALSPSVTYFSRIGSTAIASVAFMMIAIAIADGMRRRPRMIGAVGLGAAVSVWLSADAISYASTAAIVATLILVGAYRALTIDHPRLRARVWWERRRAIVLVTAIAAIVVWVPLTTALFTNSILEAVRSDLSAAFVRPTIGWERGLHTAIPILCFYEFTILILAIVGASVIVSGRVQSRFAVWTLVWAIVSAALFLSVASNDPDVVVALVIPFAMLAAFAVEWMHQSARWDSIRYAIAAAAALTLYVQILTNFVYPAPDTSEAPWNRHALLFWSEPATAIQTRKECARVENSTSLADASAMIPDDAPAIGWYLRDLAPADSAASANVVANVGPIKSGALAGNLSPAQFGFEESWHPDFQRLTVVGALRYWLTMRAWSDVAIRDLELTTSRPAGTDNPPP